MENDIEEFIKRRFASDCNWLTGNCYYFALILFNRFPGGHMMYDVVDGHFMFEWQNMFFDFSGRVYPDVNNLEDWDCMMITDPERSSRIIRDCIM